MSLQKELAREVWEASARAEDAVRTAKHLCDLSARMRTARHGEVSLCRCAWCGRLKIGEEDAWLRVEEIGRGQLRISASLLRSASHGICPDCFREQIARRGSAWALGGREDPC